MEQWQQFQIIYIPPTRALQRHHSLNRDITRSENSLQESRPVNYGQ